MGVTVKKKEKPVAFADNDNQSYMAGEDVHLLPRVLIVEQDLKFSEELRNAFQVSGYRVDTATAAGDAKKLFKRYSYEAAVIEYHLPDVKGDTLLDHFLAIQPDCVCIMMTKDPAPELTLSWMKHGASAYMLKPFDPAYLIEIYISACRERSLLRAKVLLEERTHKLQESEERYRRITESLTDYIYTCIIENGEVIKTVHGPGSIAVTGFSSQEYSDDPYLWFRMIHKEDVERVKNHAAQIVKGESFKPLEHRIYSKNGDIRWVSNTPVPSFDSYGRLVSYEGLIRDITERKEAEMHLREERERLAGILEGTNAGTWEWNIATETLIINERWAEIIGYTLKEISPVSIEKWRKFCHPDDLKESISKLERHFRRELDYYESETRMLQKSGKWVWVIERGRVIKWTEEGKPLIMMGTHQDITNIKEAEEEQKKLQNQLIQAQKMESVGRLAGGVAHDFNNMMGIIMGHAELAMDKIKSIDPVYEDIDEIMKAAKRSADLTRQLLAFARKQTISPKILDLNETVESMLKMLRRLIGEDIDLVWIPGNKLWPVMMDPSQVDQILANLCVNARDAIVNGGRVTIETGNVSLDERFCAMLEGLKAGDYVMLTVSDNGCGMDKETLSHLFEPFFTTKNVGKGTGLGLSTIYGAVKQNKGFIDVKSEPGQGATFKIYLPRHHVRTELKMESQKPKSNLKGSEIILLVEDEPVFLRLTGRMLKTLGYTVLVAGSPLEAIRLAKEYQGKINLVMTDVVMPEMNGRDLANNLLSICPGIKKMFMSGYTADVIAHHGVLDEGLHYIQKPFTLHDLSASIRKALEEK